jgi:hypothetical protein
MATPAERMRKSRAKMEEAGFVQVSVRLPKTLIAKLDLIAQKCGTSRTEVLGRLIGRITAAA